MKAFGLSLIFAGQVILDGEKFQTIKQKYVKRDPQANHKSQSFAYRMMLIDRLEKFFPWLDFSTFLRNCYIIKN